MLASPDLLVHFLFIRSTTEYCSVAFHSSLTVDQTSDLEIIQKTCSKVILGESYVHYEAALEMTGLTTLYAQREKNVLDFPLKCIKHPQNMKLFPLNTQDRNRDKSVVNEKHLSKVNNSILSKQVK